MITDAKHHRKKKDIKLPIKNQPKLNVEETHDIESVDTIN